MERKNSSGDRTSLTVEAPAKINLYFEILGKRPDGFHEVETVVLPVDWFDTLTVERLDARSGTLQIECRDDSGADLSEQIPSEKNLALCAARLLADAAGISIPTRLTLIKRIPSEAGLGGGSSDAAAAFLALNRLWRTGLSLSELAQLAATLGSDIPLFFTSGLSRCTGRGERVEPLFPVRNLCFVLYKPPQGLSTAAVYRASDALGESNRQTPTRLLNALAHGKIEEIGPALFNRLEESAQRLWPDLVEIRNEFIRAGAAAVRMTGSGTCTYALCENRSCADELAEGLMGKLPGEFRVVENLKNGTL